MGRRWLAIVVPLLVVGIFDRDLWTPDEPRAAELSREFLEPGHSLSVPTLNGEPFLEKPPLVYWTAALSINLFGANGPAARLPCVFFGLGTLLFTFLLARSLYGDETVLGATLILATTVGFLSVSHHLETDAGLTCFCAGAAYFLRRGLCGGSRWYLAMHACLLGAFMSKGFIGLVFLGLLFATWIAWTGSWKVLKSGPLWLGLGILVVPAALWLQSIGDLWRVFLIDNHLGRFSGRGDVYLGHRNLFYYYLLQFPVQAGPWFLGLILVLPRIRARLQTAETRFLLSWLIPGLLFLSAASTKRGIYAIPLLPPFAILTAQGLVDGGKGRWVPRLAAGLAGLSIIAALIAVPIVEPRKSQRPLGAAITRLEPETRICALDPDETTLAVIPFYSGRRVKPVSMSDLDALSQSSEKVVLLAGPKLTKEESDQVRRYFPVVLWSAPPNHTRPMLVLSK